MVAACCLNAQTNVWQPSSGHGQIPIWPGKVPDAQRMEGAEFAMTGDSKIAGKTWTAVKRVSCPTMTVYSPKGTNTGVAIIVFPGGGYRVLAIDLEGTEVCKLLASKGMTAILLKYRVPASGPYWDDVGKRHRDPKAPMALEDAQRTVGLTRLHASEWHINPHKIGVLGFSAGGHLVADVCTHFKRRAYAPVDDADNVSCRPDFGVAIYPGHMLEKTTRPFELNPTIPVTSNTPPCFLLQAENDPVDTVRNSLVYYAALKEAGVPVELHLYAEGGHAFGVRPTRFPITHWPDLLETWLQTIEMF